MLRASHFGLCILWLTDRVQIDDVRHFPQLVQVRVETLVQCIDASILGGGAMYRRALGRWCNVQTQAY